MAAGIVVNKKKDEISTKIFRGRNVDVEERTTPKIPLLLEKGFGG